MKKFYCENRKPIGFDPITEEVMMSMCFNDAVVLLEIKLNSEKIEKHLSCKKCWEETQKNSLIKIKKATPIPYECEVQFQAMVDELKERS